MSEDNMNNLSQFFQDISENIKKNNFNDNEIKYFKEFYLTYKFKKEIIDNLDKQNIDDKDFLRLILIISYMYTLFLYNKKQIHN
jgi:hypothetical protein